MDSSWQFLQAVLASGRRGQAAQPVFDALDSAEERRVVLACSGGADSVFLLYVFLAYAAQKNTHLVLAHYNHAWRKDADQDARFVASLARRHQLPFVAEKNARADSVSFSETTARDLRIHFLRKTARAHRCPWIAFGHQMNDILESQLQRLARGAGVDGLAAPRPMHRIHRQPTHLRPLLRLKSDKIRSMLRKAGIDWCEDVSNQDCSIQRNALRHQVLPSMQAAMDRDLLVGAANTRERLQEDAEALDRIACEAMRGLDPQQGYLELERLGVLPRAIMRRCLYRWLTEKWPLRGLGASVMDPLLDAIQSQKRAYKLTIGDFFLLIEAGRLGVQRVDASHAAAVFDYRLPLFSGQVCRLPQGASLAVEPIALGPKTLGKILQGGVDCSREVFVQGVDCQSLTIRNYLLGDRYTPMGAPGRKKLKACFRERRISKMERMQLPVVTTSQGAIVWVPHLPPADDFKLDRNSKTALWLTYQATNSP